MLYSDIIDLVSKYNKTSYEEISKIFENAGITTIKMMIKFIKRQDLIQ